LFQLYCDDGERVDIEEAKDLAAKIPELAKKLDPLLEVPLTEMKTSPPFLNPKSPAKLPNYDKVPTPVANGKEGSKVWAAYEKNGAKVDRANLIYTDSEAEKYEEWNRLPATVTESGNVEGHYLFHLVDENHFLVSYPKIRILSERGVNYSVRASENQ